MINEKYYSLGCIKRDLTSSLEDSRLPDDHVLVLRKYGLKLKCNKLEERIYIIEVHEYKGFSLIKFYPHHLKKIRQRFELRGKSIGYTLDRVNLLELFYQCALVMKNYLLQNPDNFTGYVGQVDQLDYDRKNDMSQRCRVYNRLTTSIFPKDKYRFSSEKNFNEINLRLFRNQELKLNGLMNEKQELNYRLFLEYFEGKKSQLYDLMTPTTRARVIRDLTMHNTLGDTLPLSL